MAVADASTIIVCAHADLPAIDALQRDLGASQQVINLSVSLFILLAGVRPMFWSGISEIYGRRIVYLLALTLFTISSVACSVSRSSGLFLAFRLLGSAGSSCGLTMGGATIADMYEPHERGTRVGVFYLAYLLGPSLGTFLGGALTLSQQSWRATFYFMSAFGAVCVIWAAGSRDSFRRERSVAWRKAYDRAKRLARAKEKEREKQEQEHEVRDSRGGSETIVSTADVDERPVRKEGGRPLERLTTASGEVVDVKIKFSDIK